MSVGQTANLRGKEKTSAIEKRRRQQRDRGFSEACGAEGTQGTHRTLPKVCGSPQATSSRSWGEWRAVPANLVDERVTRREKLLDHPRHFRLQQASSETGPKQRARDRAWQRGLHASSSVGTGRTRECGWRSVETRTSRERCSQHACLDAQRRELWEREASGPVCGPVIRPPTPSLSFASALGRAVRLR